MVEFNLKLARRVIHQTWIKVEQTFYQVNMLRFYKAK